MDTKELAARLRELNRTMTRGKWHTVEKPWRPDGVGTHVIAGSDDPHAGTPVLDSIEIDEWPSDAEPNYAQSDIDLGGVCFLRNNLPALLAALERGEKGGDQLCEERDDLEMRLDDFVDRLGGVQLHGEHSNLNCPWTSAAYLATNLFESMLFLRKAADGGHRIVCSCDLTQHQIVEAQASGKWYVSHDGIGYALLPWSLTTDKDIARAALSTSAGEGAKP